MCCALFVASVVCAVRPVPEAWRAGGAGRARPVSGPENRERVCGFGAGWKGHWKGLFRGGKSFVSSCIDRLGTRTRTNRTRESREKLSR